MQNIYDEWKKERGKRKVKYDNHRLAENIKNLIKNLTNPPPHYTCIV